MDNNAIRKGDLIQVMAGKERGKQGKVLRVDRGSNRLYIEKLNLIKKHSRPTQANPKGGVIEREGSIHPSSVQLVCANCRKPTRIGIKVLSDGKKLRECRKCREVMDKEAR